MIRKWENYITLIMIYRSIARVVWLEKERQRQEERASARDSASNVTPALITAGTIVQAETLLLENTVDPVSFVVTYNHTYTKTHTNYA